MKIYCNTSVNFKARPVGKQDAEYCEVLKQGKIKAGNLGKSILIIPSGSLPQSPANNTGLGNLAGEDGLKFIDFAKKYWGINEIQILPSGQFHKGSKGGYPMYSGTSMDLGNHLIDIKSYISKADYEEVVKANKNLDNINYANIVHIDSAQDKALWKLYNNISPQLKKDFELYKKQNVELLEPKALYRALCEINGSYDYTAWNDLDRKLYELEPALREKRIAEIYKQKENIIDFYKFNQFLAETDLKKAKEALNSKGIKLNGDMIVGFSYNEVWSHPKAFHKGMKIKWGLPALNLDSEEGLKLLREKVNLYAKRFDGIRVDAAWTYAKQPRTNRYYGDKILNIIEDEFRKVKGVNFDPKNVMYEFAADESDFNIHDGKKLKPYIKDRIKIYTSDSLSNDWGSNESFLQRGWGKDSFILGTTNHDSQKMKYSEKQAEALSKILKIPKKKLNSYNEFVKAKFAEPMGACNNMIFYRDALGLDAFDTKVPANYEEKYFKMLEQGEGFNPMDALEKSFKAQGLDKTERKLFKKIVKYRKLLEGTKTNSFSSWKWGFIIGGVSVLALSLIKYFKTKTSLNSTS